jgi:formate hydrogenlyase subunit 4
MSVLLALTLAPLLLGVTNRTKAAIAGRVGAPLLQPYHDLVKLTRKGAVYSRTTTWVFRAGPIVTLAAAVVAAGLLPFGSGRALVAFPGDLVLFVYLFALGRFFTVIAALDTGSSFEGMGASREVMFASLAEPALLLGLAAVARMTGSLSLSGMLEGVTGSVWAHAAPTLALAAAALLVVSSRRTAASRWMTRPRTSS